MEALTSLSVASSVIQFVDFGSKLLSKSKKLYKSKDGVLSSTIDSERIVLDLNSLLVSLRRKLPENRILSGQSPQKRSENDEALDDLCKRSVEIAEQLLRRLEKLRVGVKRPERSNTQEKEEKEIPKTQLREGLESQLERDFEARRFSKWESFRTALQESWTKHDLEELASQLREFRSEIEFRVLLTFRESLNDLAAQHNDLSHQLAQSTHLILDSFLHTRETLAAELKTQAQTLLEIKTQREKGHVTDYQTIENVTRGGLDVVGSLEIPRGLRNEDDLFQTNSPMEGQIKDQVRLLMIEDGVLGSLSFLSLSDRRESLDLPCHETFQWIYEVQKSSDRPWSSFVEWLRSGTGIYWINGKLGSGKSTLMRYVCENAQTKKELGSWSGTMPLEIAQFYFWRSGDADQKTLQGLLKSLLFEILQRHRALLPKVLPDLWRAWSARATAILSNTSPPNDTVSGFKTQPLSLHTLLRSYWVLLRELEQTHKVVLFIDGLDEFESDDGYSGIMDILRQCATSQNIKICASSRPLTVLEHFFAGSPSLRLQDLTRGDILLYVDSKLCSHRHMVALSQRHKAEASMLKDEIVRKARGVFLWVKLVVKSLLRGLSDYNRISDLKRRINYLPEDLEELYAYMLHSIEPFYHDQTSRLFQIVKAAQQCSVGRVTLLNLSWAEEEDEQLAETISIKPYTIDEIESRCREMDARLKSVCAGFLESPDSTYSSIAPDSRVSFLHRSVADWMSKQTVWDELASRTAGSGFSPNLAMLRSRVMCLKSLEMSSRTPLDMSIITDALQYARHAECDLERAFPELLDQLDITASKHWRDCGGASIIGHVDQIMPEDQVLNSMSSYQDVNLGETPSFVPGAQHHWTWAIAIPGIKKAGTASNFVEVAKNMGVTRYATLKFDSGFVVDQDVNHHLLREAIRGSSSSTGPWNWSSRHRPPNCDMIRHILRGGTDPNLSFDDDSSPWEDAIVNAAHHFMSSPEAEKEVEWRQAAEAWVTIMELLVDNGADLSLVTKRQYRLPGHPRLSLQTVIAFFPDFLAERASNLSRTLDMKKQPKV